MPVFEKGDMWTKFDDANTLFVFTANSTIKGNGDLVMGRGIARDVRDRLPGIAGKLGMLVQAQTFPDDYGLIILDFHKHKIGAFQVKTNFREAASPRLIKEAVVKLARWALSHRDVAIHINYPGIGHGRLPVAVVEPLLKDLPDNVHVWQFA